MKCPKCGSNCEMRCKAVDMTIGELHNGEVIEDITFCFVCYIRFLKEHVPIMIEDLHK